MQQDKSIVRFVGALQCGEVVDSATAVENQSTVTGGAVDTRRRGWWRSRGRWRGGSGTARGTTRALIDIEILATKST